MPLNQPPEFYRQQLLRFLGTVPQLLELRLEHPVVVTAFKLGSLDEAIVFLEKRISMGLVDVEVQQYYNRAVRLAENYIQAVTEQQDESIKRRIREAKAIPHEQRMELIEARAKREADARCRKPEGLRMFKAKQRAEQQHNSLAARMYRAAERLGL